MNEDDDERAFELYDQLWKEIHELVTERLKGENPDVEDYVRDRLTEEFRFWKP